MGYISLLTAVVIEMLFTKKAKESQPISSNSKCGTGVLRGVLGTGEGQKQEQST